jgi:hypothetical protein
MSCGDYNVTFSTAWLSVDRRFANGACFENSRTIRVLFEPREGLTEADAILKRRRLPPPNVVSKGGLVVTLNKIDALTGKFPNFLGPTSLIELPQIHHPPGGYLRTSSMQRKIKEMSGVSLKQNTLVPLRSSQVLEPHRMPLCVFLHPTWQCGIYITHPTSSGLTAHCTPLRGSKLYQPGMLFRPSTPDIC